MYSSEYSETINSTNEDSIVLVCAADDGYAMPLAVTIRSVIENLKGNRKVTLFVIDGGIKQSNKQKILRSIDPEKCNIEWIPAPHTLPKELPVSTGLLPYLSIATYYRLLIPTLLSDQVKKAIYLDCDLVVNEDIEHLWDIDIGNYYLLAVQDSGTPYVSSFPFGLARYKELGIPSDAKYFNAGVLVLDLEKWRTHNISAKILEYLVKDREYLKSADQDGMNAILAGQWGELDPRWNQIPSIFSFSSWAESPFSEDVYNDVIHNPGIIHFATVAKPWNTFENHPFRYLFFHYLDMTDWAGWRLTIPKRLWRRLQREWQSLVKLRLRGKTI
jgi:lipopolysaccharide biosynthesis glycosyltransferase